MLSCVNTHIGSHINNSYFMFHWHGANQRYRKNFFEELIHIGRRYVQHALSFHSSFCLGVVQPILISCVWKAKLILDFIILQVQTLTPIFLFMQFCKQRECLTNIAFKSLLSRAYFYEHLSKRLVMHNRAQQGLC